MIGVGLPQWGLQWDREQYDASRWGVGTGAGRAVGGKLPRGNASRKGASGQPASAGLLVGQARWSNITWGTVEDEDPIR